MKIVKFLFIALFATAMVSCSTPEEKMTKYLIGNWESIYYKEEMPSYRRKDTLVVNDADFTNPADNKANQKNLYKHKADGTFESWQTVNNYPSGRKSKGKWRVTKDSLYYEFQQGKKTVSVPFGLKVIEDGYAITAIQDRDRDGQVDDTFYLETVKLPDDVEDKK